jgi:hypothetical protein
MGPLENELMACYVCVRSIPYGELFLSLDYHIERTE